MLTGASIAVPTHRAGVLGSPIDHSLSPALHRAAYAALGLDDWAYDRFAVGGDHEPTLAEFLGALGPEWAGFSVTMPLKEDALRVAVAATEHARDVGAANTLVRDERGWVADSTDSSGLLEALRECGVEAPRHLLLLGSGATARSALDAAHRLGVDDVVIVVRQAARPETLALAHRLGLRVRIEQLADAGVFAGLVESSDITVSTLPTGTALHLPPVDTGRFAGRVLMDVVYGGWPTSLASWASAAGARVESGLPMLIHQAAAQVQLMTGRPGPVEAMRAAVEASGSNV